MTGPHTNAKTSTPAAKSPHCAGAIPRIGAIASFIGVVRDVNDGERVAEMTLEHYPGMTEKSIAEIIDQAKVALEISSTRW